MAAPPVLEVYPTAPRAERLEQAAEVLGEGGIVALPTETFYGLAVDCANVEALHAVNRLKEKEPGSPLLLLLADPGQAAQVCGALPPGFEVLASAHWPGPLTLVVPAGPGLPDAVSGGRGTVAVRVPGLALPRRLAATLGRPVTGVSANRHGEPASRTAAEVVRALGEGVALVLDGGTTPGGAPSTILDLTGERPRLLRRGALPPEALRIPGTRV